MSDGVSIELQARVPSLRGYLFKAVRDLVNETAIKLHRHIKQDLFAEYPKGTTSRTLSTRSGQLKKAVRFIPATVVEKDVVKGGIGIGTKYAKVHFGPRGRVTTIRPVNKKWLTIPLPAAMDGHGKLKGSAPDDAIYGDTFFAKSKSGNLILFGKSKYVKGSKAGQTKGDLKPLFVLKKETRIPARISPDDLMRFANPILGKGLENMKNGLLQLTMEKATGITEI